jgi:hypothetical protein
MYVVLDGTGADINVMGLDIKEASSALLLAIFSQQPTELQAPPTPLPGT